LRISKCLGPECKGGREKIIKISRPDIIPVTYHVECEECGARGSFGLSEEEAVDHWNDLIANASTYVCSKCGKSMHEDKQVYKIKEWIVLELFRRHFGVIGELDSISESLDQNKELSNAIYKLASVMGWFAQHIDKEG